MAFPIRSFAAGLAALALALAPLRAWCDASGADFLLLEPAARSAGVAGAYTASAGHVEGLRYNPAAVSGIQGVQAALAHVSASGDWNHEWAALAFNVGRLDVGAELLVSRIDPFTLYDAAGRAVDTAEAGSQNGMLTVAMPVGPSWLHVGAGLRLFRSQLYQYEAHGISMDLGLQAHKPQWHLAYGVSVQNLGSESAYFLASDPLPVCLRLGAEGLFHLDPDLAVRPHFDVVVFQDLGRPLELRGALEAELYSRAFLRAGLERAGEFQQLSLGIGIRWENLCLDYAFQPGSELGANQLIELQVASR